MISDMQRYQRVILILICFFFFLVPGMVASSQSIGQTSVALTVDTNVTSKTDTSRTVSVWIQNEGSERSIAPVLNVTSLPLHWKVKNQSSPNGTYRSSSNEWLWMSLPPDETVRTTFQLQIPANYSGTHAIRLKVHDANNNSANALISITLNPNTVTPETDQPPPDTEPPPPDTDSVTSTSTSTQQSSNNSTRTDTDSRQIQLLNELRPIIAPILILVVIVAIYMYKNK